MWGVDARLVASFLGVIAWDVLLPVAAVLWARRRWNFSWKTVGTGALAFALSQLLTRVPAVQLAQYLLREPLKHSPALQNVWMALLCLTAGLCEETARLVAFRSPLKDQRRWRDAVGFGLGHGGLESAVLVGGMAVVGLVNVVVLTRMDPSTLPLGPEQLEQVRAAQQQVAALRWWEPLWGAYERLGAMVFHVAMSVMVLQRFVRGQRRWYWLAVGCHTAFNGVALVAARTWGAVAAEGVVTVVALLCLAFLARERSREPASSEDVGQLRRTF